MGIPASALLVNQGRYENFPLYVWLADKPDGPVWSLLDREFDKWDHETGNHLAFFVDPFQRREWAYEFFRYLDIGQELTNSIFNAADAAKRFYRNRLAVNLCRFTRIGQEFLPFALISSHWDARSSTACFLSSEEDLVKLFKTLIHFSPHLIQYRQNNQFRENNESYRIADMLSRENLDVHTHRLRSSFKPILEEALGSKSINLLLQNLYAAVEEKPNIIGIQDGRTFAGLEVVTALTSLDDIINLTDDLSPYLSRLIKEFPEHPDIQYVSFKINHLTNVLHQIQDLSKQIEEAVKNGNFYGIDQAFLNFENNIIGIDMTAELIRLFGPKTYSALLNSSRITISTSEIIFKISQKINELKRDMTSTLLGYWKATEIEGRRVLQETLLKNKKVYYQNRTGEVELITSGVSSQTMGSLAMIYSTLRMEESNGKAPILHGKPISRLLFKLKDKIRNPYTHRELLTDLNELQQARLWIGCNNPSGILHLFTDCLEQLNVIDISDISEEMALPETSVLEKLEKTVEEPKIINSKFNQKSEILFDFNLTIQGHDFRCIGNQNEITDWLQRLANEDKDFFLTFANTCQNKGYPLSKTALKKIKKQLCKTKNRC